MCKQEALMIRMRWAATGLLLALALGPTTATAQTESEVEALTDLRTVPPALDRQEQARERRENLQMDGQARRIDEQVLRGICRGDC